MMNPPFRRQLGRAKRWLIRKAGLATPEKKAGPSTIPWAVAEALKLNTQELPEPTVSSSLFGRAGGQSVIGSSISSREIFSLEGIPLPCWEETHLTLYGTWLTAPDNYPVYYSVFQNLTEPGRRTRLLEIGVFTGYSGTVFARASRGPAFYLGVDPNVYLTHGLQLASRTFKTLRLKLPDFDFSLIEGFSWDDNVRDSILCSGPFDIVHVDGDHSLAGKLIDLEIARQVLTADGIVLVDDYDYHPPVADAVKRALALGWFKEFACLPKMRGLAVLRA